MPEASKEASRTQAIRIVVVDDKRSVVDGICRLCARQPGMSVVASATDGSEAMEKLALHETDLVVMDVHMAGTDGREVSAAIRRQYPAIRIILISIDEDALMRASCLRNGADSFLPKIGLQRTLMTEIKRLFPEREI